MVLTRHGGVAHGAQVIDATGLAAPSMTGACTFVGDNEERTVAVDCESCGHANTRDTYCEACGARLTTSKEDSFTEESLSLMMGLVCTSCDTYNDPGSSHCFACGVALSEMDDPADAFAALTGAASPAAAPPPEPSPAPTKQPVATWMNAPEGAPLATVNAMKAVDLSVVAGQTGSGLTAPTGTVPAPAEQPNKEVVDVGAPPPAAETPSAPIPPEFIRDLEPEPEAVPGLTPTSTACVHCQGNILVGDVFCRHCGKSQHEAAPAGTMMMGAVSAPAQADASAATTMMPSVDPQTPGASATMFFGAVTTERFARLLLLKGHTQYGTQWRIQAGETVLGRVDGNVLFPDDTHLAARHCRLVFEQDKLWVHPEATNNGVFLKVSGETPLQENSEFVIGQQRFRILSLDARRQMIALTQDGTTLAAGEPAPTPIFVARIGERPDLDEVYLRAQRILSIGRSGCDLSFATDPYISTRHAQLVRDENGYRLEDLKSRNGTFVRLREPRALVHGDQIMMGEQVLRVEVSAP